ncbi:MAG: tetratricopeptide repeat protein, partial [Candidatus Marinimicrobia bacterium]|nr:tetratricopeptide repeat protein [Candidatus Neomarinimicrobiota bacterium]
MDKERKSIYHIPKHVSGGDKPSINDINKRDDSSTFINLQGQEVDMVDEVFSISKPKVKRKKLISKNQENVSNMSAYEINQYLKRFGIKSKLTDEQKGTLLVEYLDGTEIGNLRKLYSEGEFELLKKYGEARINIHPNEIVPHLILVRTYFKMKKYEDCISQCNSILSFEPNYLDAFRFIARSHRATGMNEKAAIMFKKLAELAWDDIDSRFSLMKHYWNKKEYIIAQRYIEELLQLAPDEIRYHVYSGRILQRLQEFEKAIDRWNILLALDPDNIEALLGLGQSYYAFAEPDRGLKFLLIA